MQTIKIEIQFKEGQGYDLDSEDIGNMVTSIGCLQGIEKISVSDDEGNTLTQE